jgi:hypothetical protein
MTQYHAGGGAGLHAEEVIGIATNEQLSRWATDSDCIERELCASALAKRKEGKNGRFDPRTEISADAKHIVKHLWRLYIAAFILIPLALAVLHAILK